MPAKTPGGSRIHELDIREVKQALHEAVLKKAKRKPINGFYVQVELVDDSANPEQVGGARVWYTRELEPGQDPEKAVKVW